MENRKQKEENEMEIDLVSLFFYLIDKWKLLFLGAVVGVVLAGALVFFQTPMYESNSTLYVLSKTTSITSMADLQVGTELTSDFSVIATSKPVIDGAIKTLKKDNIKLTRKEMEEQGMDIRHIDHYNMLRNYIYTVADIYKIFFDAIQKKLETMVWEIDSLVDKNPDFIATEGKFKGCIFYQTDTDSNRVDVFDPSGNIMADFSIFQNEAIRNYEKTRLGIQGAVEHN